MQGHHLAMAPPPANTAVVPRLRPGRRLQSATVTNYAQQWTVRTASDGGRVVRAVMHVDYSVESGTHTYGFKSLVDRAHAKSVSDVRVTDASTGDALRHELSERDGYVFVKWYYNRPVSQGGVASTVVEYDVHDAVSGCSIQRPDIYGHLRELCEESFEAPWANYWKIPVENIEYTFVVPYNETGTMWVTDSLLLQEPSGCCSAPQDKVLNPDGRVTLSQRFTSSELGIGDRKPKNTVFRWQVTDPNGAISHCQQVCSEGINPLIWLTLIVPGLAIVGGLAVYCKRKNRRGRDGNESRPGVAPPPQARPLPKATAYNAEYDSNVPIASAVIVYETR